FFSSRRRHTRFSRDWSSDVCSSDLVEGTGGDRADRGAVGIDDAVARVGELLAQQRLGRHVDEGGVAHVGAAVGEGVCRGLEVQRSEEHTSELQSRENLVCRLLLEKK